MKLLVVNGVDRYLVAESVAESLREYDAALRRLRQADAVELPVHVVDGKRDEVITVALPARLRFEGVSEGASDPLGSATHADALDYARWQRLSS